MPAQQAFLPRTPSADRLPSANALLQGTYSSPPSSGRRSPAPPSHHRAPGRVCRRCRVVPLAAVVIAMLHNRPRAGAAGADGRGPGPAGAAAEPAPDEPFLAAITRAIRLRPCRQCAADDDGPSSLVLNLALNGPVMGRDAVARRPALLGGPGGTRPASPRSWSAGALVGVIVAGSSSRASDRGRIVLLIAVVVCLAVGEMLARAAAVDRRRVGLALAAIGVAIGYANIIAISWTRRRVRPRMTGTASMSLVMFMGFGHHAPLARAVRAAGGPQRDGAVRRRGPARPRNGDRGRRHGLGRPVRRARAGPGARRLAPRARSSNSVVSIDRPSASRMSTRVGCGLAGARPRTR